MTKWNVDLSHSDISFSVKHMMVSKVRGHFDAFVGSIEVEDLSDLTDASIQFEIDVASITTGNEDRDNHLKSGDFFDVENFPTISFESKEIIKEQNEYKMIGNLKIKDVTKPVSFDVVYNGKGKNPWGNDVYGFEAEASIDREDYGLTWNAMLETGGVLVGKDIKINVELELNPAS